MKIPNQKEEYEKLNKRLSKYLLMLNEIYDEANLEASKIAIATGFSGDGKTFSFKDYPKVKARVNAMLNTYAEEMQSLIYSSTSKEWKQSNLAQDLFADGVLKKKKQTINGKKLERYYQTNPDALKAFQERKDRGMNLSNKIWKQSVDYRRELEAAISCGIENGISAITLSKRVSKFLSDFPSLQKEYTQRFGKANNLYDCEYRSMRLVRSEINMAYRTAEQTRWQQFDFVVGYEIKLSKVHHHRMPDGDICDELAGKYPKDFKWTGWHPNDLCYVVPILKTDDEIWKLDGTPSKNEVTDVPEGFKKWVDNNIHRAKSWSQAPYFIKDNGNYVREDFKANLYDVQEKTFVRKWRTKLAMSRVEYYKSIYPDIPEVRLAAINAYTQVVREGNKGATFREINKRLRSGVLTDYVDIASDLISKGLRDLPKYEGIVYRGTHLSKKKFKEIYLDKIGGIIEEKAFTSTSQFKEAPIQFLSYEGIPKSHTKILFEIKGKNCRDISKISEFNGIFTEQNQYEFLFDKGTKFIMPSPPVEIDEIMYIKMVEL